MSQALRPQRPDAALPSLPQARRKTVDPSASFDIMFLCGFVSVIEGVYRQTPLARSVRLRSPASLNQSTLQLAVGPGAARARHANGDRRKRGLVRAVWVTAARPSSSRFF